MERTLGSSGFAHWRVTKCFARWIAATSRTALTSMGSGTGFPALMTAWMSFSIECVSVLLGLISDSLWQEGIHFPRNVVGRVFHPCSLATNQNGTLGDISTPFAYTALSRIIYRTGRYRTGHSPYERSRQYLGSWVTGQRNGAELKTLMCS